MFDKLFTPITIKDMTLRNRIIMPAMGTRFTEDRFVNEKHIAYHVARARGGSALNIVEVSSVHALSAPKMFLSIAEDKYIPKLKELTDAIHAEGGKAGIQLWQGGLAVGMDQTAMILLSSDTELAPGFTVPGISREMIAEVVDCYGKAAARAVAAGFDCIEFHCAHNYLPHSFLSDGLNHRTDEYGGSLENRARFPLECIRAIRAAMPEGMPLFMRIDAQDDGFGEAGLTVEDTITFCNWAKDAGVDVLDVSRGNIVTAASKYEVPPLDLPRGFNVDNAARIRKGTGMLTIGVGRINDPQQAEDILEADKVDMVVMGRAQLADPDFCNKCKEGRVEDIDRCVGCNQGCLDGFADLNMPHITCLRNPAIGRETECDAAGARRAMNATREAYDAALRVDDAVFMQDIIAGPKTVFVTGATGTMGQETVKQLLARSPRFKVRVLARPSDKNRALLKKMAHPMLEVVWGDMADFACVKRCVAGADYVLHIGAMVSPAADKYPEKTLYTNIGSTLAIIKAIQERPNADDIHLVYVGTVAETGDRQYPVQMGRCGDPINPSIHDYYAISKVFSEFAVFESGLKHWVSIRQTGQYPTNEGAGEEPIIFHQPPNNVLEWSTSIESGICMANICENWVPESFWRKAYNLSSGKGWRFTCWEFTNLMMEGMGLTFADTQDPRRMAQYNFHGHYFSDADALNDILHFRCIDPKTYQQGIVDSMKAIMQNPMIAAMIPGAEAMKAQNVQIGHKRMGYDWMMENNETDWINAFFGSKEEAEAIPSLEEGYKLFHPSEEEQKLDHGYDESKDFEALDLKDMKKAAAFRGGEVVSDKLESVYKPLVWKCAFGHTFKATPNTVLRGGHWCPECQRSEWHYAEIARKNPFYAQVWKPIHGDKHDYRIPMAYSAFDITEKLKKELNIED